MRQFRYRARRTPGDLEEGVLAAESAEAVTKILASRGLFSLSIDPVAEEPRRLGGRGTWRLADQALFARQLSDLLGGGLTIERALAVLEDQAAAAIRGATIGRVRASVRDGVPLSDSLQNEARHFPDSVVTAVRAGEASGALPEVLASIADLLEQEDATLRKVREALAYPGLVGGVAVLTLVILFTFVIPRITVLYADLEQVLPLPTRLLLVGSDLAVSFGLPALLLAAAGGLLFLRQLRGSESLRVRWGWFLLHAPVLGRILFNRECVRFCRLFGTLTAGGVSILDSLGHCATGATNAAVMYEIRDLRRGIHEGERLSELVAESEVLRGPLVAMIRVGEESGDLPAAVDKAARLYERELDGQLRRVTTFLEPLLILALGLVVGFVVFSMMLPILQMDLGTG